jgi:hypothetical protein
MAFSFPQKNVQSAADSVQPFPSLSSCASTNLKDYGHSKFQISCPFLISYVVPKIPFKSTTPVTFCNMHVLDGGIQLPSWRTTPFLLSTTVYSTYMQPLSITGSLLLHQQPLCFNTISASNGNGHYKYITLY